MNQSHFIFWNKHDQNQILNWELKKINKTLKQIYIIKHKFIAIMYKPQV